MFVNSPYNSLASLVHIRNIFLGNEKNFVDLFTNPAVIFDRIDPCSRATGTEDVVPIV